MINTLKHSITNVINLFFPEESQAILRIIYYKHKKRQAFKLISILKPLKYNDLPKYIVSLTSYKKRLTDTAPYAIISLLNQSIKPDKIILWVAHEDKEMIPDVLHLLMKKGLEIRFCEDIKSYKKLVPALLEFPEACIITADDDIYYPQNWFAQLKQSHERSPRKIICYRAREIGVDENHNPLPYNAWNIVIEPSAYFSHVFVSQEQNLPCHQLGAIFPTGLAGILYPPKCFHKEITNKDLFMTLAPYADDICFWAMAVVNKEYFGEESPYIVIPSDHRNFKSIDLQQSQGENALWNYNKLENGNDKQFKAVIEHFPQIREILKKITPFHNTKK